MLVAGIQSHETHRLRANHSAAPIMRPAMRPPTRAAPTESTPSTTRSARYPPTGKLTRIATGQTHSRRTPLLLSRASVISPPSRSYCLSLEPRTEKCGLPEGIALKRYAKVATCCRVRCRPVATGYAVSAGSARAMSALLGLSARQAVQENQQGRRTARCPVPKLGLVEEREMNLRIMTERAFLEATGPAANAAPQRCCRHRESSG